MLNLDLVFILWRSKTDRRVILDFPEVSLRICKSPAQIPFIIPYDLIFFHFACLPNDKTLWDPSLVRWLPTAACWSTCNLFPTLPRCRHDPQPSLTVTRSTPHPRMTDLAAAFLLEHPGMFPVPLTHASPPSGLIVFPRCSVRLWINLSANWVTVLIPPLARTGSRWRPAVQMKKIRLDRRQNPQSESDTRASN